MLTVTTAIRAEGGEEEAAGKGTLHGREQALSRDVIFHVLQNERRRYVLEYLQGRDEPVRMRDVAEQVAAWEHDTTVEGLTSKQRQRVYIPLYQNHLTKLDEEGIIDYNQSRGIVERKPLADQLDPYLDAETLHTAAEADDADDDLPTTDPWGRYYLGASALGALLLTAKTAGVGLVAAVPGILVGAIVLTAFSLLTLARLSAPFLVGDE